MCLMLDQNVAIEYATTQIAISPPALPFFQVYTEKKNVKNKLHMYKK